MQKLHKKWARWKNEQDRRLYIDALWEIYIGWGIFLFCLVWDFVADWLLMHHAGDVGYIQYAGMVLGLMVVVKGEQKRKQCGR